MNVKRWALAAGMTIVVLILAAAIAFKSLLPGFIRTRLMAAASESCDDCSLQIKDVETSLLDPSVFKINGISFLAGQANQSLVEARLNQFILNFSFSKSNARQIILDSIVADGLDVTYSEGEAAKKPAAKRPAKGRDEIKFGLLETTIKNLEFRYAHTWHGKTSFLHLHEVNGKIGPMGTTPDLYEALTEADFRGRIETSGRGVLKIAALLRQGPHQVDVSLEVENQKLAELNGFFTKNDGVVLGGIMKSAWAQVQARDQKAKAKIKAVYRDIEFKQEATPKTGAVEAAVATIGAQLMATKTNEGFLPSDQSAEVEVPREPKESIVHFILKSMKTSLIEVAKKKDSRK